MTIMTSGAATALRNIGPLLAAAAILVSSSVNAQSNAERDVVTANAAFERAVAARDLEAMQRLWVQDGRAMTIHPSSKAADIGWEAVRKSWAGVFERFAELTATMRETRVVIVGDAAWIIGLEEVSGKRMDGSATTYTALATNIFVREDGRWLIALHQVSRVP